MDADALPPDIGLSGAALWLVLMGALLIRLLPVFILISAIAKLLRFPALRPLHTVLIVATTFTIALGLIDTFIPAAVPEPWRASGVWSFVWIFAVAWTSVTWTRSAFKTRLRPRVPDATVLATATALVVALALPLATVW